MPRYFFNSVDRSTDFDEVGAELAHHSAARKAAIKYAGEVLANEPDVLWDGRDLRVTVCDENGTLLFTVIAMSVDAASCDPVI